MIILSKEEGKQLIIQYMKKNGKINSTNAMEKGSIVIICARSHYSRNANDHELVPFEKATKELIKEEILASDTRTANKIVITASPEKYYLDLTKVK